jgi:hypothetical protein
VGSEHVVDILAKGVEFGASAGGGVGDSNCASRHGVVFEAILRVAELGDKFTNVTFRFSKVTGVTESFDLRTEGSKDGFGKGKGHIISRKRVFFKKNNELMCALNIDREHSGVVITKYE